MCDFKLGLGRSPSLPVCFSPSPAGRLHWCSSVTTHFLPDLGTSSPASSSQTKSIQLHCYFPEISIAAGFWTIHPNSNMSQHVSSWSWHTSLASSSKPSPSKHVSYSRSPCLSLYSHPVNWNQPCITLMDHFRCELFSSEHFKSDLIGILGFMSDLFWSCRNGLTVQHHTASDIFQCTIG